MSLDQLCIGTSINKVTLLPLLLALLLCSCTDISQADPDGAVPDKGVPDKSSACSGDAVCSRYFKITGARDLITKLTFTLIPEGTGIPAKDLLVSWDFGLGTSSEFAKAKAVQQQFLSTGTYTIKAHFKDSTGKVATFTKSVSITISHPNYWPKIIPAYYMGGFTKKPVDDLLADPRNVKAVMVSAFDVYNIATKKVNTTLIDSIHRAGLLAYLDVAQWNPPWDDWDKLSAILALLVTSGLDGMDFDEFGSKKGTSIDAAKFNSLQKVLKAINPYFRMIITQVKYSELSKLLSAGATPDYVALEWYLDGSTQFDNAKSLAKKYGVRLAYWVDATTFDKIKKTYSEAGAVMLWNLCWAASTCGTQYPQNSWLPWSDIRPFLEKLGSGLEK